MTGTSHGTTERRRSVLVVEDELFIALHLQDVLEKGGFRVLGPVSSVTQAIELIDKERPDTAVLDVNLGAENAAPVAFHLKELGVPYVLASARDTRGLAWHPLLADVVNLGKPTNSQRLIDAIRAL